jgi:2,5-diamino-6-(ribosylamino)-4(3H)-pyrimidinone 5'-phosphate reductase
LGKTLEPIKVCVISNANNLKVVGDFFDKGDGKKIIFTTKKTSNKKIDEMKKKAQVFIFGEAKVNLKKALSLLSELGIKKLIVEGGGELIYSLFKDELVDEINLVIGDLIIGGRDSSTFVDGEGFNSLTAKKVKFISIIRKANRIIIKAKPVY